MMRESFLALLSGEPARRVVWTADISYWLAARFQDGTGSSAWRTEAGMLELHRELGIMPYYWYEKFWVSSVAYDDTVEVVTERAGRVSLTRWVTPVGDLREEHEFLPASCSTACTRHAVTTAADLRVLLYLLRHRRLHPANLDDYAERSEWWAAFDGVPCLGLPRSPLPAFLYEWAGVENAVFLVLDFPELVREVFAVMAAQEEAIVDAVCAVAPPVVHFPDNLSSETVASLYDEWLAPTHRRRLAKLHAAGVRCAVHLDGTVRGLLPKLAAAGFDAVEALTPAPVGDVDVADMRAVAACDDVVLWGGVPGALFAPPHTWGDMARHVGRTLDAWRGTPFVLGVADQVPPDGDIDFCRRIADMVS